MDFKLVNKFKIKSLRGGLRKQGNKMDVYFHWDSGLKLAPHIQIVVSSGRNINEIK